jgi:hypothetical protein
MMKEIDVIALATTKFKRSISAEEIAGISFGVFCLIVAAICIVLRWV